MRRPAPKRSHRFLLGAGLALLTAAVLAASLWGLAVVRGSGAQVLAGLLVRALPHAPPPAPLITISGIIFADDVRQQEAGRSVAVGIAAMVTCDGTRTEADPDGGYSLRVRASATHQCAVSAGPDYPPLSETFTPTAHGSLDVNFGPLATSVCAPGAAAFVIVCPVLRPGLGSLSGVVSSADTNQPLGGVQVQCFNPNGGSALDNNPLHYFTAQSDPTGAYTMTSMPADAYDCNAQGDWQLRPVGVPPQPAAHLDIPSCQGHCPAVRYHNGPVMHTYTAYLVFWLPPGFSYDAQGTGSFEHVLTNYFQDVGGSAYYNIATQYWDNTGPIQNSVTLGGVWTDTHAYPHAATRSDPLLSGDIEEEVGQAAIHNHWTTDMNHAIFVFTGYGAEVCDSTAHRSCSFGSSDTTFCGYHSYVSDSSAIFAEIVDNYTCVGPLYADIADGPNGDRAADVLADYVAHEQFESATDPLITAWYSSLVNAGEIGDKCYTDLGYVHLNHGHTYYLQAEWSDQINGCAFGS